MSTSSTAGIKVIDSHLHVWANAKQVADGDYSYTQEPPVALQNAASVSSLLECMDQSGVAGALIVQPINHGFDHSYVLREAMQKHPSRFKGMLLFDPSLAEAETDAVSALDDMALTGFVGVRFNPYLWPQGDGKQKQYTRLMSTGAGLAVYKRCATLRMPVGVMCFQGISLHYDDLLSLVDASPDTILILDHFGFTFLDDDTSFQQLLRLAQYNNVHVKISALFRLNDPESTYPSVFRNRFVPLLDAFGAVRLMYGSDFPFVLQQPESYDGMLQLVSSWIDQAYGNDVQGAYIAKGVILGGTAERLFGPWGSILPLSSKS